MTAPWSFAGSPDPRTDGEVVLMEGTTFCISDGRGDVGGRASGLFVRDTRILSTWTLQLGVERLEPQQLFLFGGAGLHVVLLVGWGRR